MCECGEFVEDAGAGGVGVAEGAYVVGGVGGALGVAQEGVEGAGVVDGGAAADVEHGALVGSDADEEGVAVGEVDSVGAEGGGEG